MKKNIQHHNTEKTKKKRIVLWCILGVLAAALIGAGIYAWHILKRPEAFFDAVVQQTVTPTPGTTPIIDIDAYLPSANPEATPDPTAAPDAETPQPQEQQMPEIVNVALFGIDAYENGRTTSGSMPHTDANLIVAINFKTKEVSLISIARDCLATAPGHVGFYKFNGIFNVGGGMNDPKAGLELSCRAAEEWLGGISVPYYYGVDFQALIDLVDLIGGIDFDVDIMLYTFDGRTIYPGHRHLDGQGVMAYVRMRKTASHRDTDRTARQRKMMIAIFKKLKQEGKLSMVPDILKTMGDNVYTNTTLSQTAALASFAKDVDPDSIQSYSIQGEMHQTYDWTFCFIDQERRQEILKTVYGIDAAPIGINSRRYEVFLHAQGFQTIKYLNITKKVMDAVHREATASGMSEEQKAAYARCWQDYEALQNRYSQVDRWMQAHYDDKVELTDAEQQERRAYYDALSELRDALRESANALNAAFGSPVKTAWGRNTDRWYEKDSDINEVYVDFR